MKIISSMTIKGIGKVVCADLFKEDIDMLLSFNTHNRSLNANQVDYIARSIIAGEWKFNGDTIVVDGEGVLRDGQTRLSAFKMAGYPTYRALVVYLNNSEKSADDIQKTIDKVHPRRYAQQLMLDGVGDSTNIAAIRRAILAYLSDNTSGKKFIDSELDRTGEQYRAEISAFIFLRNSSNALRFQCSAIAVICVLAHKHKCIDDLVSWCGCVAKCEGLKVGTTQHTLMRFLSSVRGRSGHDVKTEIMRKVESIVLAHINGVEDMAKVYGKQKNKRSK